MNAITQKLNAHTLNIDLSVVSTVPEINSAFEALLKGLDAMIGVDVPEARLNLQSLGEVRGYYQNIFKTRQQQLQQAPAGAQSAYKAGSDKVLARLDARLAGLEAELETPLFKRLRHGEISEESLTKLGGSITELLKASPQPSFGQGSDITVQRWLLVNALTSSEDIPAFINQHSQSFTTGGLKQIASEISNIEPLDKAALGLRVSCGALLGVMADLTPQSSIDINTWDTDKVERVTKSAMGKLEAFWNTQEVTTILNRYNNHGLKQERQDTALVIDTSQMEATTRDLLTDELKLALAQYLNSSSNPVFSNDEKALLQALASRETKRSLNLGNFFKNMNFTQPITALVLGIVSSKIMGSGLGTMVGLLSLLLGCSAPKQTT